jgi:hypothetical protein
MALTTEQMRQYQNKRRENIRAELIALLGGKCSRCGSTTELQFDHIDRSTKLFTIASGLDRPRSILLKEIAKCQLLCRLHHIEKTREDGLHPNRPLGERVSSAKLTSADVREIRLSSLSDREAALRYGVSRDQIRNVRLRRHWKHID